MGSVNRRNSARTVRWLVGVVLVGASGCGGAPPEIPYRPAAGQTRTSQIRGFTGTGSDDVWAWDPGAAPSMPVERLLHFDGASVHEVPVPPQITRAGQGFMDALAAGTRGHVWIAGHGGGLGRDPSLFDVDASGAVVDHSAEVTPAPTSFTSVQLVAGGGVVIATFIYSDSTLHSQVLRLDGSTFREIPGSDVLAGHGVFAAFGPNHIYATGGTGVMRFDGSTWQPTPLPESQLRFSLLSDTDGWAFSGTGAQFGPNGENIAVVYRFDGSTWSEAQLSGAPGNSGSILGGGGLVVVEQSTPIGVVAVAPNTARLIYRRWDNERGYIATYPIEGTRIGAERELFAVGDNCLSNCSVTTSIVGMLDDGTVLFQGPTSGEGATSPVRYATRASLR